MAQQQRQQSREQPREQPPSRLDTPEQIKKNEDLLDKILDNAKEFVPFHEKETIELTPRLVRMMFCTPTKSGQRCDEIQAAKFVMLCKARGLNPWVQDAYIVGYDTQDGPTFSLITAHQALLKRAEAHEAFEGMESGVVVQNEGDMTAPLEELQGDLVPAGKVLIGGWAKVYRKDRKIVTYRRLSVAVFDKGFGRWKIDRAGMIVKCAEGDALRSAFPNNTGGMQLDGDLPDTDHLPLKTEAPRPPVGRNKISNGTPAPPIAAPVTPPPAPPPAQELPETPERQPGDDDVEGEADQSDDLDAAVERDNAQQFVENFSREIDDVRTLPELEEVKAKIEAAKLPEGFAVGLTNKIDEKRATLTGKPTPRRQAPRL